MERTLEDLLREHRQTAMVVFPTIGKQCWQLLVTGPDPAVQSWAVAVWPEVFDYRRQTLRCRLWVRDDIDGPMRRVVEAAKIHDVTLQLLCGHEVLEASAETIDLGSGASVTVRSHRETYPVLHLGSHGLRWGGIGDHDGTVHNG